MAIVVLLVAGGTDLVAQTKMRIGVFDSRAVAIAHGNSPERGEYVSKLQSELAKAKLAEDGVRAKEIEAKGKSAQILAHLQAFSTSSVSDILQKHKSEIYRIAIEMDVAAIVSKFELIYFRGGMEKVEVTARLVEMFKPGPQAQKWIKEITKQNPLPLIDALSVPEDH